MLLTRIEAWAYKVIDRVATGKPNEDARVELKAEWPEAAKAARRIAGHANAARGEPILWLIGVDQARGVIGVDAEELADWYPRMSAEFDQPPPSLTDVNVYVGDKTVVALLFHTDRIPFVIRNPVRGRQGAGPVTWEVPWREGTSVRSATRADLIRLLTPLERRPDIEILDGEIEVLDRYGGEVEDFDAPHRFTWSLALQLYIVPRGERMLIIPFHRCEVSVVAPGFLHRTPLGDLRLAPPSTGGRFANEQGRNLSLTIEGTANEVLVKGAGVLNLYAHCDTDDLPEGITEQPMHVNVRLVFTDEDTPITLDPTLHPSWVRNLAKDDPRADEGYFRSGGIEARWAFGPNSLQVASPTDE